MRYLIKQYLGGEVSRRSFLRGLTAAGVSSSSAQAVLSSLAPLLQEERRRGEWKEGTGGELLAEQLIASGVRYVFGNSGTGDAGFYDALVDRPQLHYVLVPHEGPLAAMALGYSQASRKTAYLCVAGMVGMANFMGQMFNAFKSQDNVVFVAYKRESSRVAGRNVHEEVFHQEILAEPFTKWRWIAKNAASLPEVLRRAFKLASTPPFGPVYLGYHHDTLLERARAWIVPQEYYDLPLRIRPHPQDVERAARWILEAQSPVLIAGDEVYKSGAFEKVVELAEKVGIVVGAQRSCYANFPEDHPLFVGDYSPQMRFPEHQDLVLNVGSRLQLGASPGEALIPPQVRFIDLRLDARHVADVFPTDLPLVADVGEALRDLNAALDDVMTPALRERARERMARAREFTSRVRQSQELIRRSSLWDSRPILPARLSWELSQLLEPDAVLVRESMDSFGFQFNPLGGRVFFHNFGAHLGWGVGAAAGVKLAWPDRQVVCTVGDGSFLFGPHALWTMARMEIPVLVVVFNNHAYNGTANRAAALANNRMAKTGRLVHYYLGNPDMDMSRIAAGFGVEGEKVRAPSEIRPALERGLRATREGKPYLVDVDVARSGSWAHNEDQPWYPEFSLASRRRRRV